MGTSSAWPVRSEAIVMVEIGEHDREASGTTRVPLGAIGVRGDAVRDFARRALLGRYRDIGEVLEDQEDLV